MIPRLEGPTLPPESQGQVLPVLLGDLFLDVPGIPLQVGQSALLAYPCGVDELDTLTTLRLTGPDVERTLGMVPRPWVVAIDQEWFRYTGVATDPPRLTGVTRAYGGTVAADHAAQATVYFVEPRPLYAFAVAWPGLRYPSDAVVSVRIDDASPVPFYTARLQDTRPLPGWRVLTVEFDLTRYQGGPSSARGQRSFVIAGGSDAPEPWILPSGQILRPIAGGSSGYLVSGAIDSLSGSSRVMSLDRPAAAHEPAPARQTLGQSPVRTRTTPGGAQAVRVFAQPLGRVTADLKGLLDTVGGRYTSVPSGPIVRLAHQARAVLEHGYGEATGDRFHQPSWDETDTRQAARGWTGRIQWAGQPLREFADAVGFCGQAELYVDDEGRWRYHYRDPNAAPVFTLTTRERIGDVALEWTSTEVLATRLEVTWGNGYQGGAFTLTSEAMRTRYGPLVRTLDLPHATSEKTARQLARYWLSQWDRPRLTADAGVPFALAGLTRTDRGWIDDPVLTTYGERRVPLEIRGTTDRGSERRLALVEADPLGLSVPLSGQISIDQALERLLSGAIQPGLVCPLSGAIDSGDDVLFDSWRVTAGGTGATW